MMLHRQHRHTRRWHLSIINILVTIPAVLFAIPVHAIPAFTAAADIPDAAPTPTQIPTQIPTPTSTSTTPTTYTVITKISSTTLTTSSPVLHIFPHILSLITTMTVTTYEPWPAFPSENLDSTWSTTVLEEVVSSVTWVERRRYLNVVDAGGTGDGHGGEEEEEEVRGRGEGKERQDEEEEEKGKEEETTITSFVVTTENTWVVHPARPTDGIFLATGVGVVGCGGCSLPSARPESTQRPRTGTGLETRARLEDLVGSSDRQSLEAQGQYERGGEGRQDKFGQPQGTRAMVNSLTRQAVVPLEDRVVMDTEEDPVCKSTNLTTGCQGQCIWKPAVFYNLQAINPSSTHPEAHPATTAAGTGTYWCLHIHPYHYADPSLRMGRACWGPYLRYRQLNAPCLVGDVGMACLPCVKGGEGEPGKKDEGWDAVFWEGEE